MKQFKALIIKEWQTYWKIMLSPAWFLLANYAFILIIFIYTYFTSNSEMNILVSSQQGNLDALIWGVHFGSSILLGFLATLGSMNLADNVINQDSIRKCDIFHYSLPVSLKKIIASKYIFVIFGSFVTFVVLAVANSILMSAISSIYGLSNLSLGLNGVMNAIPYTLMSLLVFPPLCGFFASIFKRNSFISMLGIIILLDIMLYMLNIWLGVGYFSIYRYYMRVLAAPLNTITMILSGQYPSFSFFAWQDISHIDTLIRLGISCVLIVGTYFLVKRRELS